MSLYDENAELNGIMSKKVLKAVKPSNPRTTNYYSGGDWDEEEDKVDLLGFKQWSTCDNVKFLPAGKTSKILVPGFYEPKLSSSSGYYLEKLDCKIEGLLEFPETNCKRVIDEIQNFWEKGDLFKAHNLVHKRGIILWGPPGSGKSCTIKLVLKDVLSRGGIAMKFNVPDIFIECVRIFRKIQPDSPLLVLMEDIDSIISEFGETDVLNILDGVESVNKVVYLATTNYPEELGERIINRPSRFDRRFKMPHPGKSSRKLYFEHLFEKEVIDMKKLGVDLNRWVKDTENMSIAHLKELFIAVCILGDPYEEVVKVLRSMVEEKISSGEDKSDNFGFKTYNSNE